MEKLRTFPKADRSRVDEDLFEGDKQLTDDDLSRSPGEIDVPVDLAPVEHFFDEIVSGECEYDKRHLIDADAAPVVHKCLENLTRHQASNAAIWHYLAVIWHPEFVRHRWPYDDSDRTFESMREKFLGAGNDIYGNAIGRLWWMAELSYDEGASDPYEPTQNILQVQYLANRVFDPAFARYRPAVVAFAEVLSDESTDVIGPANRRFNQALSTLHLESRSKREIRNIVEEVVAGVKEDYGV